MQGPHHHHHHLPLSPPLSSSLSMGAQLLPKPFTAHRAKAGPVKLVKWHYSGQFFSLYLKCLNVWQTNQSSDAACEGSREACEREVRCTDLDPLPTHQLVTRYKKPTRSLALKSSSRPQVSSPADTHSPSMESVRAAFTDLQYVE